LLLVPEIVNAIYTKTTVGASWANDAIRTDGHSRRSAPNSCWSISV